MLLLGPYASSCFLLCILTLAKWVMSQTECNCPGGCDLTDVCYTTDCTEKNVAVGKTAESSPLYSNSHPACVAVNGITDSDGDCTGTAQNDVTPFWRVDLGQFYTIQHMTIYGRAAWFGRMRGLKMYVDNQLCHTIGDESSYSPPGDRRPVPINVQCNTTLTGRYVTLVKNFTGTVDKFHFELLSVCEIQVWAAPTTTSEQPLKSTQESGFVSSTKAPAIKSSTTRRSKTSSDAELTTDGNSGSSAMESGEGSATAGIAGVVAGVLGLLLVVAVIVIVVLIIRGKRRRTQNGQNTTEPLPRGDGADTAVDDTNTGSPVSGDNKDPASTIGNVYEIIEEGGHYYEPLSHRDNTYINDNTLYTNPVFTTGEEGGRGLLNE